MSTAPFLTIRASLTSVGGGRVEITPSDGPKVALPVELPSEERLLGQHLHEPVVLAILPAFGAERGPEEHLAWYRAEVGRLRDLLGQLKDGGVTGARVEHGPKLLCITAPAEAFERAILDEVTAWLASRVEAPEVGVKLRELTRRAEQAEALAGLLAWAATLPNEGKRLGPGPCEVLQALAGDEALQGRCGVSMRKLLDANQAAAAERTFAVDAAEWGGTRGPDDDDQGKGLQPEGLS